MEAWVPWLLPFLLLLARVSAFVAVLPIFGWRALPVIVRAGMALVVTVFFAAVRPPAPLGQVRWLATSALLVEELLCGLALGLAGRFVFLAVQQGGRIAGQQMGFADAGIFDPSAGEQDRPIALFFQMAFVLYFLVAGGHHVLLAIIDGSFRAFPVGGGVDPGRLAEGLVRAGSAMLTFALKFAAPMLAGFLILSVVLAILSRVLPEMNVLLTSFPLRVGLGLFLAAAIVPALRSFTAELARWMRRFLVA